MIRKAIKKFRTQRYYSLYKKLIVQLVSYAEVVMYRWVRNFLMAFLIMLVVRVTFFILGEFLNLWYGDIEQDIPVGLVIVPATKAQHPGTDIQHT